MTSDILIISLISAGAFGALVVVSSSNHINICFGYLLAIFSVSGIFLFLNNNYAAYTLFILHWISVFLIISFGVSASGFYVKVSGEKKKTVILFSFITSFLIFSVLTLTLLKGDLKTLDFAGIPVSLGVLLTNKYVVLFEILALSMATAVTGTFFIFKGRD